MRILVIEDTKSHIEAAKEFFKDKSGIEVVFAEDYLSARPLESFDGVISDIFFPLKKGDTTWGQVEPIGVSIMIQCQKGNIPCVLNTAGYHHGSRYQWICDLQRTLELPEIVDATGDYFKDADKKNWERAFEKLKEAIASKK